MIRDQNADKTGQCQTCGDDRIGQRRGNRDAECGGEENCAAPSRGFADSGEKTDELVDVNQAVPV